jgi:hypothetical protein
MTMRGRLGTVALLTFSAALFPAAAQAADHIDCILSLRNDTVDKSVFEAYRKGANIGEALVGMRLPEIRACVQTNKWSAPATESATRVLLGEILAVGLKKEMAANALPADGLTAALASFMNGVGTDTARRAANGDMDKETIGSLIAKLQAEHVVSDAQLSEKNGVLIGEYMSAYANSSVYRLDFKTQ